MYNWEFWKGRSRPNRVTWGLWTYIAVLNATSYLGTSHDIVKTFVALENMGMCGFTFGCVCLHGKTERLKPWEWATVAFGTTAGTVWILSRDAFYANAVLQLGTAVSFIPIYAGLWKNPKREPILPWLVWSVVYVVFFFAVLLRWNGAWHDLIYPLTYVIIHVVVFFLTLRRVTQPQIQGLQQEG